MAGTAHWQAAEKGEFGRTSVTQPLLPVLVLLHLLVTHSQEWLCHQGFSATC
jgi:hypothetical protein